MEPQTTQDPQIEDQAQIPIINNYATNWIKIFIVIVGLLIPVIVGIFYFSKTKNPILNIKKSVQKKIQTSTSKSTSIKLQTGFVISLPD